MLAAPFRRVVTAALLVSCVAIPAVAAARTELRETGSTLLYPVFSAWVTRFNHADIAVTTEATGSGAGVQAAVDGSAALGASDAFLSDEQLAQGLINVPLAVSAQHIAVHLSEIGQKPLHLSAETLAEIYSGKINFWDDAHLVAINPELRGTLPHRAIYPVVRSDRSGDTFLFTSYLNGQAPAAWPKKPATSVAWPPVANEQAAKGNSAVLELVKNTPGGIGFVGITYLEQTRADGLTVAALRNRDGKFVEPRASNIAAAVAHAGPVARDGRMNLVNLSGAATYPIVNLGYAVVKKQQPSAENAAALRTFLGWIVDAQGGNAPALLDPVHFAPLPDPVRAVARELIAQIK